MKIFLRKNEKHGHWEASVNFPGEKDEPFYLIGSTVDVPAETVISNVRRCNPGATVEIV
jgi:hypothetical protein